MLNCSFVKYYALTFVSIKNLTMKNVMISFIAVSLIGCTKENVELPRDKFLGSWKAFNAVTTQQVSTSVAKGSKDNLILWTIAGETIELEFIGQADSVAFQTNFSVPIFADNSASLRYISKDSLFGIRTVGSIFLPNYKTTHYRISK